MSNLPIFRFFFSWVTCGLILAGFHAQGAEDPNALITRVLQTNKPWLDPKPANGLYSLWRQASDGTNEILGPYSLSQTTNRWNAARVGSQVWTPLHVMARQESPYIVSSAGTTNWNGLSVIAVDVSFNSNVSCALGMGGQGKASYAHIDYHQIRSARILIEPTNAVPVYMDTHPSPTNISQFSPTWSFEPSFLAVDGGLAPSSLDFDGLTSFIERQEFQVVGNVWLFKVGDAWYSPANPFGKAGHIQTIEMVNLEIEVPMTVRSAGTDVLIALPSGVAVGFGVDSADRPEGPWLPVTSELSQDSSTISVRKPADKPAQFFRLRK